MSHQNQDHWPAWVLVHLRTKSPKRPCGLTRTLAGELRDVGILVNAVCPGWVAADMGGAGAPRSVSDGVAGIVWAATLPDNGPTGGFFRDGKPLPW
jgi:NAD(P)-dependent dehydrogenase (short-subunit alcohol dehydrogenase family)